MDFLNSDICSFRNLWIGLIENLILSHFIYILQ
uniref:Uncharacterized protein n=1 Tax=Arundo donax TaxID=35708 RepID=A0A0A9ELW4_ARUDO